MTNFKCLNMSNDEIIIRSFIPNFDKKNINIDIIKDYKHIYKNKTLLCNKLSEIDKLKLKKCLICNMEFSKIQDVKDHLILYCFEKEMEKIYKNKNDNNNENNIKNLFIKNESPHIEININNNITNIFVNANNPIPFDENWDLSNLDIKDKSHIIFSQYMYSILLEEILNNNNNLNVIIDKEKDIGIVYKNEIDKYIKMEIKEIISNSMNKLYKNLLHINDELKTKDYMDKIILNNKDQDINKKYEIYKNNNDKNTGVNNCLSDIFNNKKIESQIIMDKYLDNENNKFIGY